MENFFTSRARGALRNAFYLNLLTNKMDGNKSRIQSIHILFGLSSEDGSLSKNILEAHGITRKKISEALNLSDKKIIELEKELALMPGRNVATFNAEARMLVKKAVSLAMRHSQPYVGTEHLLYALACNAADKNKPGLKSKNSESKDSIFTHIQVKILTFKKANEIKKHLKGVFSQNMPIPNLARFPKHNKSKVPILFNSSHRHNHLEHAHDKEYSQTRKQIQKKKRSVTAMEIFCENLTLAAEKKELDPVIGRENEISRLINILSRRTKNNPILIGEPGVGKTAIVQGLAQKITNGDVPENLINKEVMALNLNSLIAGAIFRGDFEARIQQVIHEVSENNTILFIDEVHTIIGAGSIPGSLDAANILKPALSSGKVQCIGATTLEEYKKYVEKDRALERRFQPIFVKEESEKQSIITLLNLKKIYEDYHNIIIDADAIKSAVELSSRYIKDRFLPDKAIDVLDEAASRLRTVAFKNADTKALRELEQTKKMLISKKEEAISRENYKDALTSRYREEMIQREIDELKKRTKKHLRRPVLTHKHIEEIIESMTGIPLYRSGNEHTALKNLEDKLKKEIVGQERAISELLYTIKKNKAGISDPKRPVGSFLFVGPSGVGKTALAKVVAELQSQNLVKLDMSEYAEPYSISRLIGAPPGYIGYEEGGELTEKIRRNPYSIVLFDEIEKAHPQIHNILLSILDEGVLQDAHGKEVSFKNTTIILTSNANLEEYFGIKKSIGFSVKTNRDLKVAGEKYKDYIKNILKKEVISRVDKTIIFRELNKSDLEKIAGLLLNKLKENLSKNNLEITFSENVAGFIAQKSYKPGEGARMIRTAIEKYVENPLAEYIVLNQNAKTITIFQDGAKIRVK